ncbi:hypothetical protein HII13_003460 [Brettanomyces bruxellensis]|nr:hypothetical protein HII13_003460 [Brettanomyces bruxellensis]
MPFLQIKFSPTIRQAFGPAQTLHHTHHLSPAKSVASLYRSASKLARSRSRSSSQATAVPSTSTIATSQTALSSTKTAIKETHKQEKNTESTPKRSKSSVHSSEDQTPVSQTSTAVESSNLSHDLNDSPLKGKSSKSSQVSKLPLLDPFPTVSVQISNSEKIVEPTNPENSDMSTPVEKSINTAASKVEKATSPSKTEALKDKAKKASSTIKENASKASDTIKENASKASGTIKENASKASKEADNFFKKIISAVTGGLSSVASTTETVVLNYPVATSNFTAILSAGLTTLLFQKTCPKYTPKCPTKHLYGGVFSIVASTLAIVDSFAIYYNHKKQLTN